MSYPKDLDEIPDAALNYELQRRISKRYGGNCSYCGKPLAANKEAAKNGCRFHEYQECNGPIKVVRGGLAE